MSGRKGWTHTRPIRGATNEWQTPPDLLRLLGPFDDDPALPGRADGLTRPWQGFVWMNPPYGPEIGRWMRRMSDHGNGLALVFARVDTAWFHECVWERATAVGFFRGRLRFYLVGVRARDYAGSPSCLVAYGVEAVARMRRVPGLVVVRPDGG